MTEYEYWWMEAESGPHERSRVTQYPRVEFREVDPWLISGDTPRYARAWVDADNEGAPITAADLNRYPRAELREFEATLPVATAWGDERPRARTWAGALNARIAQDEVMASLRREAHFRAEQIEIALDQQEAAEWWEKARPIKHGETVPERPVRFSWMDGPA